MAGRGSLAGLMPYGNANAIVKEMAFEVLTAVERTPVVAGVCATDPFMITDVFLGELKALGFAGIQNFPTVGLIDGQFRANLEETGMGFDREIECIRRAHELDLLTTPYAFDPDQARKLAEAVEPVEDLVDDRAAGRGVVVGEQVGAARRVVGGLDPADGPVDARPQRRRGVGGRLALLKLLKRRSISGMPPSAPEPQADEIAGLLGDGLLGR
jgi:predicted TIM-barrel enzyme